MTELEKIKEATNTAHIYLGFIAGLGAALDLLRDAPPSVRTPIFRRMMNTNVDNVREVIAEHKKIRDDRLLHPRRVS